MPRELRDYLRYVPYLCLVFTKDIAPRYSRMNSSSPLPLDALIIGAGLTGLTTAYHLKQAGQSLHLIEQRERTGGVIESYQEGGFIYESGPTTGIISHAAVPRLLSNFPGLMRIASPEANCRLILKSLEKKKGEQQTFLPLPASPLAGLRTPLFTLKDKLNILLEPFRARGCREDESIAELVVRRLGKSFLDYAVDPFIGGIYAGDPHRLVTCYALPKLYALEEQYGSFIRGAIAKAREPKDKEARSVTKEIFSTAGGLSHLTEALTTHIGTEHFSLGVPDCRIIRTEEGLYEARFTTQEGTQTLCARHLITTVPAPVLGDLLPFLTAKDLAPITSLRYAPIVQVTWGMRSTQLPHFYAFGGLVPSHEDHQLLGILHPSACFDDRAPQGGTLLSIFLGGMRAPEVIDYSDEEIEALVSERLQRLLGITGTPDLFRIFRHRMAIPQYEASSGARLERIAELEGRFSGLHLAGAIRDGIGIPDRIKQGEALARLIQQELYAHQ